MSWSTEQLAAIQARHQNLLVAAAAGSGKTSVLVERIIQRVLDEKEPVDIDRMLVVTFTNAAAAEMRERVGAALTEALKERQDAKDIERQLLLLNSASISTIHSFCQNVIRQHFHLLSISPKFRVANEVETGLLKMNLLEKLLEEKYCAAEPGFLAIVEHFSGEKNDDSLYGLVLGLYDFSRSHPKPDTWLLELTKNYTLPNDADIEDTPWSKIIRDKFILDMKGLRQGMERLTCELAEPGNPDAYIAVFRSDIAVLDGLIASGNDSWQRLYTAIHSCEFERLPSAGKEFSKEAKEYFQGERNKVKKKINDIRDTLFARSPEALLEDMRMVAPVVSALVSLVIEFGAEYTKAKRSKGLLDFSDLEHYCLEVLSEEGENGNLLPSPAAKALQEKYVEIMVDEYQDTNGVQEAILQLVARTNEPNLFMVGDVKQSIYRFRLAEPELFLQKYRSYGEKDGQQCRIDLAKNYRSRAGILQAINFLFRQVMKPDVAELEYGDAECLNPGADYPLTDEKCFKGQVEVLVLDNTSARGQDPRKEEPDEFEEQKDGQSAVEQDPEEEFTGFELESQMIVQRIKELAASGCYVWDKASKHYRPLAWRDIVILLRSVKGKADILLETLRQAGIPVYAELSEGYFQEIEVQVILSLLSIVDNPRQDIHLAGVLRSPLYEFSEAELAEIRLCNRQGDLWEAVVKAAEVLDGEQESIRLKTKNFLAQLNGWRNMTRSKGVPELVWKIYRDTGYYDYVGGLPGGVIRQANLRALYDRARQYENTNFRGLFRFLRFIEKLKDKGSDLSVARALGESEDVVRVMSIHKSKGIEFPVVFVADMNKQFNMQDSHQSVVKHKKLGLGVYASPPGVRLKYPTIARHGIAVKQEMETRAEELRVLYVAMTRAREKLILTASVKDLAQKCRKWHGQASVTDEFLPDSSIAGANTYMDWLGPALIRHPDGQVLTDYAGCKHLDALHAEDFHWDVKIVHSSELAQSEKQVADTVLLDKVRGLGPLEDGEGTDWVEQILGWKYPYQMTVDKPAKMSVTEIKRRFETESSSESERLYENKHIYDQPHFIQTTRKLTPAELGTAMHTLMQHVDLKGDLSIEGLKLQMNGLVQREILLPEHSGELKLEAVAGFFYSRLGQRMLAAEYLKREVPFSLMLPAAQFYPEMKNSEEKVFVQGVIDCLFKDQDGLVIIDYKTDRVQNSAAELKGKYDIQLAIYAQAIQTIFKEAVKEKYLYVFSTGETVKL